MDMTVVYMLGQRGRRKLGLQCVYKLLTESGEKSTPNDLLLRTRAPAGPCNLLPCDAVLGALSSGRAESPFLSSCPISTDLPCYHPVPSLPPCSHGLGADTILGGEV